MQVLECMETGLMHHRWHLSLLYRKVLTLEIVLNALHTTFTCLSTCMNIYCLNGLYFGHKTWLVECSCASGKVSVPLEFSKYKKKKKKDLVIKFSLVWLLIVIAFMSIKLSQCEVIHAWRRRRWIIIIFNNSQGDNPQTESSTSTHWQHKLKTRLKQNWT